MDNRRLSAVRFRGMGAPSLSLVLLPFITLSSLGATSSVEYNHDTLFSRWPQDIQHLSPGAAQSQGDTICKEPFQSYARQCHSYPATG